MKSDQIIYELNINGVSVEIVHTPRYFHSSDHVEWWSVPCSVTETGYYSNWLPVDSQKEQVINYIKELGQDVKVFIKPLEQQTLF